MKKRCLTYPRCPPVISEFSQASQTNQQHALSSSTPVIVPDGVTKKRKKERERKGRKEERKKGRKSKEKKKRKKKEK